MNNDYKIQNIKTHNIICQVLDAFKIGHGDINVTTGPTVTRFEFPVNFGTRASRLRNLKDEIAMALHVQSVRIIAPTENGNIGIEVPNTDRQTISITSMFYSDEYLNNDMQLPICLGRKVDNSVLMADLATMPHLLVAGATGMGKSVGLNVIIASLINRLSPSELKMVLIDPKQVELSVYETIARQYIAHLRDKPAICTEPEQATETLNAVIRLMEKRYTLLKQSGARNIQEYNRSVDSKKLAAKLPYIVVIIDEYGDLIMQATGREMERLICRLAQKARAVGIHLIISTQRPDTKIVTGSIKANFPTRIAFRTTTGTDSRVILDRMGAEKLTGKGDMLFFAGNDPVRAQCAFISTEEVQAMCNEIADEYTECKENILPEPPATYSKPVLLFKEILPETISVFQHLSEYDKIDTFDIYKILNGSMAYLDVHSQLNEIGVTDRFNNVLTHDINEMYQRAYNTYNQE